MNGTELIQRHYWAAETDPHRLASKIESAFRRWQRELERRGWSARIDMATRRYFGTDPDGGASQTHDIVPGGEQGELDLTSVAHFRSIVRSIFTLGTSARASFRATATSDTAEAMAACQLADQLWEHELTHGLESATLTAAERMLVQGEASILVLWDDVAGKIVSAQPVFETDDDGQPVMDDVPGELDPMTGQPVMMQQPRVIDEKPVHEGKLVYEVVGPYDVARDVHARDLSNLPWVIIRRVMRRWDLVAMYGEDEAAARHIVGAPGPEYMHDQRQDEHDAVSLDFEDMVFVLELYHASTPAMPGGRFARVCGGHLLAEDALVYSRIPVIMKSPGQVFDKSLGYSDTFDLLGLSKLIDSAVTNMASTVNRHGQTPVILPEESDIAPRDLVGPGVVRVPRDGSGRLVKPEWMEVAEIPASHLQWTEFLQKQSEVLSGINPVVRGNPQESLKSGAALALVHAQALQHNSSFQRANAELLRDTATLVIELYRDHAHTDRIIQIAGDGERGTVRAFTGQDLGPVSEVSVELANAMLRTTAGKMEIADKICDPKMFPADEPVRRTQYLGFLESGRLEPITRASRSEEIGIKAECEALAKGQPVTALISDNHAAHIREHKALLDGRQRMAIPVPAIQAIDQHIQQHEMLWMQLTLTRPTLLAATGQQPAPAAPQPPMPPGPGAGAGGPPHGPPGHGGPPGAMQQPPPTGQPEVPGNGPGQPQLPKAPINPATGQRVPLTNGVMG